MPDSKAIPNCFPEDAVFIAGAGRFGLRAAEVLTSLQKSPVWLIDCDEKAFSGTEKLPISRIVMDAVQFLKESFPILTPSQTIVPAVPSHLAFNWLAQYAEGEIIKEETPEEIKTCLPNSWISQEGTLLVSYADFLCPEDCPEPADCCTITGKKRGTPLYERLRRSELAGRRVYVIQSRQLAPGVGGYKVADLSNLLKEVRSNPGGKWILGTACKCHGVITAFRIRQNPFSRGDAGTQRGKSEIRFL